MSESRWYQTGLHVRVDWSCLKAEARRLMGGEEYFLVRDRIHIFGMVFATNRSEIDWVAVSAR